MLLGQLCCKHHLARVDSKKQQNTLRTSHDFSYFSQETAKQSNRDKCQIRLSLNVNKQDKMISNNVSFVNDSNTNTFEQKNAISFNPFSKEFRNSLCMDCHSRLNCPDPKLLKSEESKSEQNIFSKKDEINLINKLSHRIPLESSPSCSLNSSTETLEDSNTLMCSMVDILNTKSTLKLNQPLHTSEPNIATQQFLGIEELQCETNYDSRTESVCWDVIKPFGNILKRPHYRYHHDLGTSSHEQTVQEKCTASRIVKSIDNLGKRYPKRDQRLDDCNVVMASSYPPRYVSNQNHFRKLSNKHNFGGKSNKHFLLYHNYHSSLTQPSSPTFYDPDNEPIHMTLEEVKDQIKQIQKASSESAVNCMSKSFQKTKEFSCKPRQKKDIIKCRDKKINIKDSLCTFFGLRKSSIDIKSKPVEKVPVVASKSNPPCSSNFRANCCSSPYVNRALPPIPPQESEVCSDANSSVSFFASLQKVKDCGWYWGPISGSMAEAILADKSDNSFLVRDSSDDYYIFSVTFKLNKEVHHVRIEHNQGNFSFGSMETFKFNTIIEFIEKAVEHSHGGGYLFFLRSKPGLAPIQVQLLYPVSRFKLVHSLQHLCRFVILKNIRRDHISSLPLPLRLLNYLNQKQYYAEHITE